MPEIGKKEIKKSEDPIEQLNILEEEDRIRLNGRYKYIIDDLKVLISTPITDINNKKIYSLYKNKLIAQVPYLYKTIQNPDKISEVELIEQIIYCKTEEFDNMSSYYYTKLFEYWNNEDMEEILKHFDNLNHQLLDKKYREIAEDVFKCIPMKMEQFYEKFDKQCMQMPIFKYYDSYQLFQRISCASNEDIVLIKEKLIDRVERYQEKIEPEMRNIKLLKQIMDDYLKDKGTTIKIVMLREFSKDLGYILGKYKTSFLG